MEYYVKITKQTTNGPTSLYATDYDVKWGDHRDICDFGSREVAEEWIKLENTGSYTLMSGEIARPEYEVTEGHNAEHDCVSHIAETKNWQIIHRSDIPMDIFDRLSISDVRYSHNARGVEIWSTHFDGYRISYAVKPEAAQYHADDMSRLKWEYPTFYKATRLKLGKNFVFIDLKDQDEE